MLRILGLLEGRIVMTEIYLRKSTSDDLDSIMEIINEAKALLKKEGSPQWQDGHPRREQIKADIQSGSSWVLMVGNEIAGTAALTTKPEADYETITDGNWVGDEHYATIHRIAIASRFRGMQLGKMIFSNLLTAGLLAGFKDFRIDTHAVNIRMQKLAQNFGFEKRGIVQVVDKIDRRRIAFELNL